MLLLRSRFLGQKPLFACQDLGKIPFIANNREQLNLLFGKSGKIARVLSINFRDSRTWEFLSPQHFDTLSEVLGRLFLCI